jgi:hypothetical protein
MSDLWDIYKSAVFLSCQPFGLSERYAIITAFNPKGKTLTDCENRARDYRLQEFIAQQKANNRCVYGCSPDLTHREKSWMVNFDKDKAIEVGKAFDQNAIYWVENGVLFLTPCLSEECEETVGDVRSRIIADVHLAFE